jgi:hypothetical protein
VGFDRVDTMDGGGVVDDTVLGELGTGRLGGLLEPVGEAHAGAAYDLDLPTPMSVNARRDGDP